MQEGVESSRKPRVIALLPAAVAAPEVADGIELVRVPSGYEAAGELLAAPAAALVVDLGRITPDHAPLLDLARRLELPVIGFGTVSADLSSAQLSRLRLVTPAGVGPALRELLPAAPKAAEAPAPPESAEEQTPSPAPARLEPCAVPGRSGGLTQADLDALLEQGP